AGLSLYLLSSLVVIAVGERMRRAQRHAYASARLAGARQRQVENEMKERRLAEEAVRESEEQARRDLTDMSLLQDFSRRLVKAGNLRSVLEQVLDVAIAITYAEHGSVQ